MPQDSHDVVDTDESMQDQSEASLDVIDQSPKMKFFSGATAPGLRIRSSPSFSVSIVTVVSCGCTS